jgi:hypothetical protein
VRHLAPGVGLLAHDPRGGAVSSVFLYVAIVAIWAFVLVPRWLRRHHAQPRTLVGIDVASDAEFEASESAGDGGALEDTDYPADMAEPADHPAPARRSAPKTVPSLARSRMLQARRRLLTMLMLLTAGAGAAAATRLVPVWMCAAPVGVLSCYFLLLRAAARADAEHAHRMAAFHVRQARTAAAARRRAAVAAAALPGAQIIDISSRVADQLYDQYADAAVRAVGD